MTSPSNQAVNALAFLMHEVRPDWDAPGCVAALRRVPQVGLVDLVVAAVKCAADPANDTPVALVHMNNRAWDSDWYLPCRKHPEQRARRTNGECASCFADRVEAVAFPERKPTPPSKPLRVMVSDVRQSLAEAKPSDGAA